MKAIILAGGFGTRIKPLTVNTPKPMLPLVNRPILVHVIDLLKRHGIDEVMMLLYYYPDVIKNYFGDGADFDIRVKYYTPDRDYGTAGAVRFAKDFVGSDRTIIISGDLLTDFDLGSLIKEHIAKKAEATIGLTRVSNPLQFGIVITDKSGKILKFLEKPTWGEVFSDTINTGIYVFEPQVFNYIPEGREYDFSKDLFPWMLENGKPLYGAILNGYWRDIGDTDSYRFAHYDVFEGKVQIEVPGKKLNLIGRDVRIGDEVSICANVKFKGTVVLGNNTRIKDNVSLYNVSIGNNCTIGENVVIENSIIWDNVYIDEGAVIKGAVIGNSVRISKDVRIDEGAVVADETSVGKGAIIKEGVKIWPRKIVEEGAVVSSNLVWGEKWRKSLFEGAKVIGLTNIEITPEFAAKLGAAYGSILPKNEYVLMGRDSHPASRMLRRAFMGGLASTGVHVRDARMTPIPVFSYKIQSVGEIGGVFFRQSQDDPPSTEIIFFDKNGMEIPPGTAKSIERIFYREDFRRVHHNESGVIHTLSRIFDYYREAYVNQLNTKQIKSRGFKLVIDFSHGSVSQFFPDILNDIGVDFIGLNAYIDTTRLAKPENEVKIHLEQLSTILKSLKVNLGFYLFPSGTKLILIDEIGRIHKDLDLLVLLTWLFIKNYKNSKIAVPNYAPMVIEEFAKKNGVKLDRISSSPREMFEYAHKESAKLVGSGEGEFILPDFHYAPDAMFVIGKILELLSKDTTTIAEIYDEIPKTILLVEKFSCPVDLKGTVMRMMSEVARYEKASLLDGVKIFYDKSWVMLRPDPYKPYVYLYVEADTDEKAQALMNEYREKVLTWIKIGKSEKE